MHSFESVYIDTPRLQQHVLMCGEGDVLLLVHGNLSSSVFYKQLMLSLADSYRCIAVDLRGYGRTQAIPLDATRGARDWSEDLAQLLLALNVDRAHCVGWSAGAAAVMQLAIDKADVVASLTLIAPVSPFGFGGTKGLEGDACQPDFAGSGGGLVSPELIKRIQAGDKTADAAESPLNLLRTLYVKEPFEFHQEHELLEGMLEQQTGEQFYPGDSIASPYWPFTSPGKWGAINALSAKYLNLSEFSQIDPKPPVLWVRGDSDLIVSDASLCDIAVLGQMGVFPGWTDQLDFPAQPMVSQTRFLLDNYQKNGGTYHEVEMQNVGHSPFLEAPEKFRKELITFLNGL